MTPKRRLLTLISVCLCFKKSFLINNDFHWKKEYLPHGWSCGSLTYVSGEVEATSLLGIDVMRAKARTGIPLDYRFFGNFDYLKKLVRRLAVNYVMSDIIKLSSWHHLHNCNVTLYHQCTGVNFSGKVQAMKFKHRFSVRIFYIHP